MPTVRESIHAPEFQQGEWFNSPPLSMTALHGRVVLVDFWCYTCVNCLRTLPYVREWWRRYREIGLLIIGIHAPEFTFEKQRENLQAAIQRLDIGYPVLTDNEYRNWSTWANRYWPSIYLVDANGYIRFFQYGEGHYQEIESDIQDLLHHNLPDAVFPPLMPPLRDTDAPDAVCYRATPELDLGYERSRFGNPSADHIGQIVQYAYQEEEAGDTVFLEGYWRSTQESVVLSSEEGSIYIRYRGKEVNLVAQPPEGDSGYLLIEQDYQPLPLNALGEDAHQDGASIAVHVDSPRMYNLVQNPHFGEHRLRIRVMTPGLAAFALTFVTECIREQRSTDKAA